MGNHQQWIISNAYVYTKPDPFPAILHDLVAIEPQLYSDMRITRMAVFALEMDASNPSGER